MLILHSDLTIYRLCGKKICLQGLRPDPEVIHILPIFQGVNNKDVDQAAQMYRLVCAFVGHMQQK